MPPPSLSTTTSVRSTGRSCRPSRPFVSCRNATSPSRATVGRRGSASATPTAVDTTPSMPFAPRLATTRTSDRGAAYHSRSRTGIDDATTSVDSSGVAARAARAIAGSVGLGMCGEDRVDALPAPCRRRLATRPATRGRACRSSGPARCTPTSGRPARHVRARVVGIDPRAVRMDEHLPRVRTRQATAPAPWRPARRRVGARRSGGWPRRTAHDGGSRRTMRPPPDPGCDSRSGRRPGSAIRSPGPARGRRPGRPRPGRRRSRLAALRADRSTAPGPAW